LKIGIIADTHDNLPNIRKAVSILQSEGVSALMHVGDFVSPFSLRELLKFHGPIYAVFGNNDGEKRGLSGMLQGIAEGYRTLELDGKKILMCHILEDIPPEAYEGVDLILTAHTHRLYIGDGTPLIINPGEAGGWLTGRSTVVVYDLRSGVEKVFEIPSSPVI